METQNTISKGAVMEEILRNYFLDTGYYVVRGIKYKYEESDITDIDLYLYSRSSTFIRERINVDIKNKKTPQFFERVLWANGLKALLKFNTCIVATTDNRPFIHNFGKIHDTVVLDGSFLSKLKNSYGDKDRLSDEDLLKEFAKYKCYRLFRNKDWRYIYDLSKSRLLTETDFAGFNSQLISIKYFFEEIMTDNQKRESATRMLYLIISHTLIIMDYILKDITLLDSHTRSKQLLDGINFGNLGKEGVEKIINMATKISGSSNKIYNPNDIEQNTAFILTDFFSKIENSKNLFIWAKELELKGYAKELIEPNELDLAHKSLISVLLDYFSMDRVSFFSQYRNKNKIQQLNL